ncbi:MAG: hypothetical protein ACI4DP_02250 [Candidatus Ornithomonoglobus sp.]
MEFKKKILSAVITAALTAGISLPTLAHYDFAASTGEYSWNTAGETQVTGANNLVADGQLQLGISNSKSDVRYKSNRTLVWWNGGNENGTSNNRKLVFTPKYSGRVTLNAGSISNSSTLKAKLVIKHDSIEDVSKELSSSTFSATETVNFDVSAGTVYTIYPEGGDSSLTGAYITSFVFTAPSRAVTYSETAPEKLTDENEPESAAFYGEVVSVGSDASVGFKLTAAVEGGGTAEGTILFDASAFTDDNKKFGAVIKECTTCGVGNITAEYYTGE